MITLKIDRNTWLRGEGSDTSYLLRPSDKKMCCLGFLCGQYNSIYEFLGHQTVDEDDLPESVYDALENGLSAPTLEELYCINDSEVLSDVEREQELTKLFAGAGINVEFYN